MKTLLSLIFLFLLSAVSYGQAPCSYLVKNLNTDYQGGNLTFFVETQVGCEWTAESSSDWVRITSRNAGNGTGYVSFFIDDSTNPWGFTTLKIAGRQLTVYRTGGGCAFIFNPQPIPASGGAIDFGMIKSDDACKIMPRGHFWQPSWSDGVGAAPNTGASRFGAIVFVVGWRPGDPLSVQNGTAHVLVTQEAGAKSRKRVRFF